MEPADSRLRLTDLEKGAGGAGKPALLHVVHALRRDFALDDLNEADKLHPNDAMILNNRGIAHQKLGDAKKAAADFQRCDQLASLLPSSALC